MKPQTQASWFSRFRSGDLPPRFHVAVLAVILTVGILFQYSFYLPVTEPLKAVIPSDALETIIHAAPLPWYIVPIAYAALTLGRLASLILLLLTVSALAPHVLIEETASEQAALFMNILSVMTGGTVVIGLANWWHTERRAREQALHRAQEEAQANALLHRAAEALADAPDEQGVLRVLGEIGLSELGGAFVYVGLLPAQGTELENLLVFHEEDDFGRSLEELLRATP